MRWPASQLKHPHETMHAYAALAADLACLYAKPRRPDRSLDQILQEIQWIECGVASSGQDNMAKVVDVPRAGVVVLLCVLLVLSSMVTTTEAGRQLGMRSAVLAASATKAAAETVIGKVMREEMEVDDVVGVGESKRRSPGGPDPQHH
ncbi:hypothetical protein HU200_019153 [Digitaria exilis]|uniref:Uncharacterized protein n=1 Tax=Digitaria exilis TaxID=1010633 RepID=A0A835KCI1_9POAL|nr:hypothetical protein HU200_019153 [Digitaria exilis]